VYGKGRDFVEQPRERIAALPHTKKGEKKTPQTHNTQTDPLTHHGSSSFSPSQILSPDTFALKKEKKELSQDDDHNHGTDHRASNSVQTLPQQIAALNE